MLRSKINVDADSASKGKIFIKMTEFESGDVQRLGVNVNRGQVVGAVSVSASTTTIAADSDTGDSSTVTVTVKDDTKGSKGIAGVEVTLIATNGSLTVDERGHDHGDGGFAQAVCDSDQVCKLTTREAVPGIDAEDDGDFDDAGDTAPVAEGTIVVTLSGSSRVGDGLLTATIGEESGSKAFIFSGSGKNLEAEVEQGSVERGGSVFVVFTVTDSGGNPVKDASPVETAKDSIVGPGEDPTTVDLDYTVPKVSKGKTVIPPCVGSDAVDASDGIEAVAAIPGGIERQGRVRHPGERSVG